MHSALDLTLESIVRSQVDKASKFVFNIRETAIEFNYIDNESGKDIVCTPTQTSCNMGCTFCFLTGLDLPVKSLTPDEMVYGVGKVIQHCRKEDHETLLISFMGAGEPLVNKNNVIEAARVIEGAYKNAYKTVRFAIATIMPKAILMRELTAQVKESGLNFKVHLSLHSAINEERIEIMPNVIDVRESISLLQEYMHETGNETEIHYTLIAGVNDSNSHLCHLTDLLRDTGITVKFLNFIESGELRASSRVGFFRECLETCGVSTEFYVPPGEDIGTSCGQFLVDEK